MEEESQTRRRLGGEAPQRINVSATPRDDAKTTHIALTLLP
jgi:hypothetical protein